MEILKETEIQYCTTCGAANKKSAFICDKCGKKIILRHRPVADFIKKRIKGKATGTIIEKLFDIIKNFLFDHLYGLVLTVSIVATAATVVVTATPYIETVKVFPLAVVEGEAEEVEEKEPEVDPEYADWCEKHAIYMMSHYIDHAEAVVWAHDGYTVSPDNISLNEIYAERVIPGFNYQGAHEMMTVHVPLGMYHNGTPDSPDGVSEIQNCIEGSYKFGKDVTSQLGQTLYADGYEVMECDYEICLYEGLDRDGTRASTPVEREVFRVLFVRHGENNWYIAEDVLVDRIKGETYDLYRQYGHNGIITE